MRHVGQQDAGEHCSRGVVTDIPGPGLARFSVQTLTKLYAVLPRIYELASSLPDAPLQKFVEATKTLPATTEVERLRIERIGQNIFRKSLEAYWQGCCPLTGIADAALLRASHIKPWAKSSDFERFDVHNGLLLSALWDAAFDRGLVTFEDDGTPCFAATLGDKSRAALKYDAPLPLTPQHHTYLAWHRKEMFALQILPSNGSSEVGSSST